MKSCLKIIIIGGIIVAAGISTSVIADSLFTSVLWDSNASFSVYDQEFMTIEDWEAKAVDEFWTYGISIYLGYGIAGTGIIVSIIGAIRTIRDTKIENQNK